MQYFDRGTSVKPYCVFYFIATGKIRESSETFWTYVQFAPLASAGFFVGFICFVEINKRWFLRVIFLVLAMICLAAAINSGERASLIIIVVLTPFYLIYSGRVLKLLNLKIVPLYLIILVSLYFGGKFIQSDQGERLRFRFTKIAFDDPNERDARLNIKGDFFRPFFENIKGSPLLGAGPANYFHDNRGYYPHNMFLELGGEAGFAGLILYFWIIYRYSAGMFRFNHLAYKKYFIYTVIIIGMMILLRTFKTGDIVGNRLFWLFAVLFLQQLRISNRIADRMIRPSRSDNNEIID